MQGKHRGMLRAYAWPAAWVVSGFVLAEVLRQVAEATSTRWPAMLAVWVSLLALLAGTARALWVTWRLWRDHSSGGGVPPAAGSGA